MEMHTIKIKNMTTSVDYASFKYQISEYMRKMGAEKSRTAKETTASALYELLDLNRDHWQFGDLQLADGRFCKAVSDKLIEMSVVEQWKDAKQWYKRWFLWDRIAVRRFHLCAQCEANAHVQCRTCKDRYCENCADFFCFTDDLSTNPTRTDEEQIAQWLDDGGPNTTICYRCSPIHDARREKLRVDWDTFCEYQLIPSICGLVIEYL